MSILIKFKRDDIDVDVDCDMSYLDPGTLDYTFVITTPKDKFSITGGTMKGLFARLEGILNYYDK